jgi:hypothetical protein
MGRIGIENWTKGKRTGGYRFVSILTVKTVGVIIYS